jgi:hypothetical protein
MKSLQELGMADMASATVSALGDLLRSAKVDLRSLPYMRDDAAGTVTLEEDTYTHSAGHLRLMGFCAVCGQEVPSKPIRRLADVADLKRAFRPEKHECLDV